MLHTLKNIALSAFKEKNEYEEVEKKSQRAVIKSASLKNGELTVGTQSFNLNDIWHVDFLRHAPENSRDKMDVFVRIKGKHGPFGGRISELLYLGSLTANTKTANFLREKLAETGVRLNEEPTHYKKGLTCTI